MSRVNEFPPEVTRKLRTYVYRLIDPRTGRTFYVGKGRGNRVFAHIREEKDLKGDPEDNKLRTIREIHAAGLEVAHVIHRHGMDDTTAFAVEAALIDAYPGLDNRVAGVGASAYGVAHADEIVRRYRMGAASFEQHKALLINVNRSMTEKSLYEATRYAWKLSRRRAEQAEVVLAVERGMIIGAFVPEQWLEATQANFPGLAEEDLPGRIGFIGREAPPDISSIYKDRRVPETYRRRGAANPVKYTWKS